MNIHKKNKTILILGAGAGMAQPFIKLLFKQWQQCTFYLLARNTAVLQPLATQGTSLGHTVELHHYDLAEMALPSFTGVEFCITYVGWLPANNEEPDKAMLLNCTGVELFINRLIETNTETLKTILITGSIAGVRVRPANRAYGLAKAALHKYALELQQKWAGRIGVTLVIPGYVSTKMLAGIQAPALLVSSPEKLAAKYETWMASQPKIVYSQPVWRLISVILKGMPEFIVNRMKQ